jgi:hypothetical protein
MNVRAAEQEKVAVQNKRFLHQPREAPSAADQSYWSRLVPRGPTEILLLAVVILVISLHLKYLLDVRTGVPHQDEWSLLDEMFQALDEHRAGSWVFESRNGHFRAPAALAYLASLRFWSLDLTPLRLLNFPICLAAFFLIAHVTNVDVKSRVTRFYLYLGVCFVVFNLCFWEDFSQGGGFIMTLSALFGGIGLYYIVRGLQFPRRRERSLTMGVVFLLASLLSFGLGYAAAASAIALLTLIGLRKLTASRVIPGYRKILYCLACAMGLLAIVSHPLFHIKSRIVQLVFHMVLVAGSVGASFLDDKNSPLVQNVAFACGLVLIVASLSIGLHFLVKRKPSRADLLFVFSLALVLFGLFGCLAVAVARSQLPDGEFLSSRYTLFPSIGILGILLASACLNAFWLAGMWCFAAAGYLAGTVKELQIAPYRPAVYAAIEVAIRNIDGVSDEKLRATLYFRENTDGVRRVGARMRKDRLNVFRGSQRTDNAQP